MPPQDSQIPSSRLLRLSNAFCLESLPVPGLPLLASAGGAQAPVSGRDHQDWLNDQQSPAEERVCGSSHLGWSDLQQWRGNCGNQDSGYIQRILPQETGARLRKRFVSCVCSQIPLFFFLAHFFCNGSSFRFGRHFIFTAQREGLNLENLSWTQDSVCYLIFRPSETLKTAIQALLKLNSCAYKQSKRLFGGFRTKESSLEKFWFLCLFTASYKLTPLLQFPW